MTPGLFSTAPARVPSLPSPTSPPSLPANTDAAATASPRRLVLPKDLPAAIKQLDDQELDRLQGAVLAEQKRRCRKPAASVEPLDRRRIEAVAVHLTPGKLNAVRFALKAGVKPSQIARQFGLSQSDVRKALAGDASRRSPIRPWQTPSSTASFTTPTASTSMVTAFERRPPNKPVLTPTLPHDLMMPSTGALSATIGTLSAFNRNRCPRSSESAPDPQLPAPWAHPWPPRQAWEARGGVWGAAIAIEPSDFVSLSCGNPFVLSYSRATTGTCRRSRSGSEGGVGASGRRTARKPMETDARWIALRSVVLPGAL
jgi:hypothetical protein